MSECIQLTGMPRDEQEHAQKCQFQYEMCYQHCELSGTEKCLGIEFCAHWRGFKL